MVEFLHDDRAGEWKIIELNPRLWGSVMLSEFCGAELLIRYINRLEGGEPEMPEEQPGRYIRWLFPFEVISLLKGKLAFGNF
jgi:predicted ATP-grasp superfamily ATP-dependent carboligase